MTVVTIASGTLAAHLATAKDSTQEYYVAALDGGSFSRAGLDVVIDYGGFVIANLTATEVILLRNSGSPRWTLEPVNHTTGRGAYRGDLAAGDPVPTGQRVSAYGLFIVQFHGPAQPSWLQQLRENSSMVIDYLPHHAYLVQASPGEAAKFAGLPFYRGHVVYHPAFKQSVKIQDGQTQFLIVLNQTANATAFASRINATHNNAARTAWETIIDVNTARSNLADIAADAETLWIEPSQRSSSYTARYASASLQGNTKTTFPVHDLGATGWGQLIAVCDSGLDTTRHAGDPAGTLRATHEMFGGPDAGTFPFIQRYSSSADLPSATARGQHPKVAFYYATAELDPVTNAWRDIGDQDIGSAHGPIMASIAAGNKGSDGRDGDDGVAFASRLIVCDRQSSPDLSRQQLDHSALWKPAYDAGARIVSNSWGVERTEGNYTLLARGNDLFAAAHPDMLILRSMGNPLNDGDLVKKIGQEAVAKNVLSVGTTQSYRLTAGDTLAVLGSPGTISAKTTFGPTADGRMKPNIVAPGQCLMGGSSGSADYVCEVATSPATAAAAGAAALVRDYFERGFFPHGVANSSGSVVPSSAFLRALLMVSGNELAIDNSESGFPNRVQGWGRPILTWVLAEPGQARRIVYADGNHSLVPGGSVDLRVHVNSSSLPFRAMLTWTDPAAAVGTIWDRALVNDLDLRVISPSGTVYLGNLRNDNVAAPADGNSTSDRVNVEEAVYISGAEAGDYTIRVSAQAFGWTDPQPFALVVNGAVRWST